MTHAIRRQQLTGLDTTQKVWRLYAEQHLTQRQIASELGISQAAVSRALARAERLALAQLGQGIETHRAMVLTATRAMYREAVHAWERSKDGTTKKTSGQVEGGKRIGQGPERSAEVETTDTPGDPKYLAQALKALEGIRKVLGLDAPTRVEVTEPLRPLANMPDDQLYQEAADLLLKVGIDVRVQASVQTAPGPHRRRTTAQPW